MILSSTLVYSEVKQNQRKHSVKDKYLIETCSYLGGWNNGECVHHPVGILLPDLGDQECSQSRSGATTEGVGHLEALETEKKYVVKK